MDETDLAILREMFIDRVVRFGGLDPRISAYQIADRLGLSHTTIASRLQSWERRGLFNGCLVFPNPNLVNLHFYGFETRLASAHATARLRNLVDRLPGAWHYWEMVQLFWITLVAPGLDAANRVASTVAATAGVKGVDDPVELGMPSVSVTLTPTDWKLIGGAQSCFPPTPARLADSLGISRRTVRRRLDRLMDHLALLFLPRLDHTRMPGVLGYVAVQLSDATPATQAWGTVHDLWKVVLPIAQWGSGDMTWKFPQLRVEDSFRLLGFFVAAESPVSILNKVHRLEEADGVLHVSVDFPIRIDGRPEVFEPIIRRGYELRHGNRPLIGK